MKDWMKVLALGIVLLFPEGLQAQAGTKSMAETIEPVCKKYGYEAIEIYDDTTRATCVDKDENWVLSEVSSEYVSTTPQKNNISLAIDVVVQIGSKDTKTELVSVVNKALKLKKANYSVVAKNGTVVYVLQDGSIRFANFKVVTKNNPSKLNTIAKKIEPVCKKYGLSAKSLNKTDASCFDKNNKDLVVVDNKVVKSSSHPYSKKYELAVDVAYLIGKKDTKTEMTRVIKVAVKTPHKYIKTKMGLPIYADKGGRVYIPYTKAVIDGINEVIKNSKK